MTVSLSRIASMVVMKQRYGRRAGRIKHLDVLPAMRPVKMSLSVFQEIQATWNYLIFVMDMKHVEMKIKFAQNLEIPNRFSLQSLAQKTPYQNSYLSA